MRGLLRCGIAIRSLSAWGLGCVKTLDCTRNFEACGHVQSKKMQKFVLRSALRPNEISFLHGLGQNENLPRSRLCQLPPAADITAHRTRPPRALSPLTRRIEGARYVGRSDRHLNGTKPRLRRGFFVSTLCQQRCKLGRSKCHSKAFGLH